MTHIRSLTPSAVLAILMLVDVLPCTAEESVLRWQQREQNRIDMLARIAPAVVCVMPPNGQGGGSGVLVSADGYAITNYHVTSGSGDFLKCGLNNGQVYDAVIVGIDPTGDVAMIQLLGRDDFPFATPGNSDEVQIGDEVVALGNPFLLADDFSPTVTYGIASGIHRYQYPSGTFLEYTDCIQIDASINPGNSGGPLFDIAGRWIGINGRASFEQRGRVNVGAAYAISVRQVQLFMSHLRSGRIVDHGTAEFAVRTESDGKVVVTDVVDISEAYRRGIRRDDELISFAGRDLSSANDFKNILGIFPSGARVPLTFRNRDGKYTATIRLRPLHEFQQAPQLPEERKPPGPPQPDDHDEKDPHDADGPDDEEEPAIPEQYASLFEARDGFANYAFNLRQQQRLLLPLRESLDDTPGLDNTWVLTVSDNDNSSMELVVGQGGAGLKQRDTPWHQDASDLKAEVEPPDYPGLLTGLIQCHRLFLDAPDTWSDIVYIGTEMQAPTFEFVDVLRTNAGLVSCRWQFRDDSEFPFGVDVEFAAGSDEARLLFADWTTTGKLPHPRRLGIIVPDTGDVTWLTVANAELRE